MEVNPITRSCPASMTDGGKSDERKFQKKKKEGEGSKHPTCTPPGFSACHDPGDRITISYDGSGRKNVGRTGW